MRDYYNQKENRTMKHKIKHYMAALLLTSMVWSGHAQEKNEMDLSGEWAFQTDVMDFRRGSLDVRYCHRLQESIVLPGITDDYKIGYKSPYRHLDRLTRVYGIYGPRMVPAGNRDSCGMERQTHFPLF